MVPWIDRGWMRVVVEGGVIDLDFPILQYLPLMKRGAASPWWFECKCWRMRSAEEAWLWS